MGREASQIMPTLVIAMQYGQSYAYRAGGRPVPSSSLSVTMIMEWAGDIYFRLEENLVFVGSYRQLSAGYWTPLRKACLTRASGTKAG